MCNLLAKNIKNELLYWIINYLNIIIIWRWVVLVHRLNPKENQKKEDHVTIYIT